MRPYTRHLAICGAANVIAGQPLQTWPGIPAASAAMSGFLHVSRIGENSENRGRRLIRVKDAAPNASVTLLCGGRWPSPSSTPWPAVVADHA